MSNISKEFLPKPAIPIDLYDETHDIENFILTSLAMSGSISRYALKERFQSIATINQVIWRLIENGKIHYEEDNWDWLLPNEDV